MAGPLMGILNQAGGAMFGTQVGQALGGLAGEVLTASDVGLPSDPRARRRCCRPTWPGSPRSSTCPPRTCCSTWRCARPRTSGCSGTSRGWAPVGRRGGLRAGTTIDVSKIEESMRHRPTNPAALGTPWRAGCSSRRRPPSRPRGSARDRAGDRGWVDEVVGQATESRMPAAGRLQEAVRRRRAAEVPRNGPAHGGTVEARAAAAGCATPPPCGARCAPRGARRARRRLAHPDLRAGRPRRPARLP